MSFVQTEHGQNFLFPQMYVRFGKASQVGFVHNHHHRKQFLPTEVPSLNQRLEPASSPRHICGANVLWY
jgi:hypothetical protein